ncbi:MAG: hypothetical protein RBQ94_03495 [Methanimicrococcus sp.]|nr:hypothetical protein [Methanimicrococcus sp.]
MSKYFLKNSETILKKLQEDVNNSDGKDKRNPAANSSEICDEKRTVIDYTRKSRNMTAYNPVAGRRKI